MLGGLLSRVLRGPSAGASSPVARATLMALTLAISSGCEDEREPPQFLFLAPSQGGSSAPSQGGSSKPAPPLAESRSVDGTWAILAKEMDATVVELGGVPHGCQSGWGDAAPYSGSYAANCCGPVLFGVEGDQVSFDLSVGEDCVGTPLHYVIEGTLSARGDRIGGIHTIIEAEPGRTPFPRSFPGAAIRYERMLEPGPFPVGPEWPPQIRNEFLGSTFETATQQGPFAPGERYRLSLFVTAIKGDLGEYLGTEITFEETGPDSFIVHAGPVSETLPDRPIALTVHYERALPTSAEVLMPSGELFTLTPAPYEPWPY